MVSQTRESLTLPRSAAASLSRRRRVSRMHPLIYVVLIVGAVVSIVPFLYMVMTSFKSYGSLINNVFWPWPPFGAEPFL